MYAKSRFFFISSPLRHSATAAENLSAAVVHRDHEAANAAVYSNVGRDECWAVFEVAGVIYDPMLQTCVFEG